MQKRGFCPKQGKSLKNYAIFRFSCKPKGTISSVRKHVFEKKCCKSVAKTVTRKVPSPETLDITGFSATSKPKGTTPTRSIQLFTKLFCLVNISLLYRYSNCFLLSFCNSKFTVSKQYHHLLYRLYCIIGAYRSQHFKVIKLSFISV